MQITPEMIEPLPLGERSPNPGGARVFLQQFFVCPESIAQNRSNPSLHKKDGNHEGSNDDRLEPPFLTELRQVHIICGRATKQIELHPGNRWYRGLVASYKFLYQNCRSQMQKSMIVESLLCDITRNRGRFVEKVVLMSNGSTKPYKEQDSLKEGEMIVYRDVPFKTINEKVRKALRRTERARALRCTSH